MRSLVKRHATLLVFSCCLGGSTAFVACGSDPASTAPIDFDAGDSGPIVGNGGTGAGGRASTGGAPAAGGTGAGGASTGGQGGQGGTGTGGQEAGVEAGPDAITSNGDAATD
jgi:hypothetical protein